LTALRRDRRDFYGDPTYNPFERPSMPLASLALDGVLGGRPVSDSGEPVDPVKGLAIPTAYRCIAIISTVVASLTLEEVQKNGDAERWPVLDGLISGTQFEVMELIAARIAGWGNYFAKKVLQGSKLIDLVPYPAGDVLVIKVKGKKTYRIKRRNEDGTLAADPGKPNGVIYDDITDGPDCPVFHIPGFGYDGLQGISPIMLAAQTMGTAIAADRLAARFYSRGQQLGGIISVKAPLAKQSQADAIKLAWRNTHSGVQNMGDVAVLDAETAFTPITIAPEALQFLQSRQWQATEVARMFGVPPHLVGELEKSTSWGAGIEQQNIGFVAYTIRSYTDRTEQRFSRDFGTRGKPLEFDLDRLLRGSMMERFQAYGQGIGWGWLTRAEVRKKERMKPKPGLDEPLMPQSMNGALADGPMGGGQTMAGAQNAKGQNPNPSKDDEDQDDSGN
jgi:HK97 family phage portal protein